MKNHKDNDWYKKEKVEQESAKKATEDVIYNKLFIRKNVNPNQDSKTFIADSGATSHVLNLKENMKNLKNTKTQ